MVLWATSNERMFDPPSVIIAVRPDVSGFWYVGGMSLTSIEWNNNKATLPRGKLPRGNRRRGMSDHKSLLFSGD
jgi:hypothetical protein